VRNAAAVSPNCAATTPSRCGVSLSMMRRGGEALMAPFINHTFAQMSYLFWIYFRALAALRLPARRIGVPATCQLQSIAKPLSVEANAVP
jgi:hypothetical protein